MISCQNLVFGQLDHLISFRPNASILANEAYVMYSFNKTSEWLGKLSDTERNTYLDESRKERREVRSQFKERIKEIKKKRIEVQTRRKLELQRLEKLRIAKADDLTNGVCFCGLWQNPQEEGIIELDGN